MLLRALLLAAAAGAGVPPPQQQRAAVAVLRDPSVPEPFNASELVGALARQPALHVATVSAAELADPAAVAPARFRVLAVPNTPALPSAGLRNYQAYAMGGGSLLLLGGKPRIMPVQWGDPAAHINVMEDYAPLRMPDVVEVDATSPNPIVPPGCFGVNGS